ncbi:MAG: FAD-dependent oxidoreductase [Gammaproteobacteria bacterium]|nr:FAD-dependent oxidoreductase [Gammaproteobacteria bacterium]
MKIAIVGTGISGMLAAYRLQQRHQVTVFEAGDYIGGHSNTVDVSLGDGHWSIDTGFIVFNDRTYPNFIALMDELGVASQPSRMTFSVSCNETGLEYCGGNLNEVFAQRRNLVRPSFLAMLRDILRFNREARKLLDDSQDSRSLGDYLDDEGYGQPFVRDYIIPMAAAIWSTDHELMFRFPARHFIRFFDNHGLLQLKDRPQWRTITGGSRQYVTRLTAPYADRIRLNTPVQQVERFDDRVEITASGTTETFDVVFIATHSDQALAMLIRPTRNESDILGAIPYQPNTAVLHTDPALLPHRPLARAAWNYLRKRAADTRVALTYYMNILQSIDAPHDFCVTVNRDDDIDPAGVIQRIDYAHPVFTTTGVAAQRRYDEVNGVNRTYYCGAYWGYGFHEDGVNSALAALRAFDRHEKDEKLYLRRAS